MPSAAARPPRTSLERSAAGDSLDQYLADIRRYTLLTTEEEVALARRIQSGDDEAADELVSRNLRFVLAVAKRYRGCGLPFMDLVSEGNIGLLTAAHKFDPDRGVRFISYAGWWVRQAIMVALARQAHVVTIPVARASEYSRIARGAKTLQQTLGREPRTAEIAAFCELPLETVQSFLGFANSDISLDAPPDEDSDRTLIEQFIACETPEADETTFDGQLTDRVRDALECLPPREATILRLHFGLDGEGEHTLEKIGSKLGITRERVRQIRDRALRRLRTSDAGRSLVELAA